MFKSAPRKSAQGGFTLIELVVVIVILGILAAFAVPRFASLDRQARTASVRSLEGAVRSGAMLAHSVWLASGTNPPSIAMEGAPTINIINGYPAATATNGIATTLTQGSVVATNDTSAGRYRVFVNGTTMDFRLNGATNPLRCFVRYAQPTAPGNNPNITVDAAQC